jgi:c-di-GMP-binding flagellar brake protein YcgR
MMLSSQQQKTLSSVTALESTEGIERYVLNARRDVLAVMQTLANAPVPLELTVEQLNVSISSMLLKVTPAFEELVFDATGLSGLERLDGSAGVRVKAHFDTLWYSFEAMFAEVAPGRSRPALRARLPDQVKRMQRRDSIRYPVPSVNPPVCDVRGKNEWEEVEHLRSLDISLSGISLLLKAKHSVFQRDDRISGCTLHLPDIGALQTDLIVAHVSPLGSGDERRMGCRFSNMLATSLAHLRRYVMRLERERLQSLAREAADTA